jgi:hypothetical protein
MSTIVNKGEENFNIKYIGPLNSKGKPDKRSKEWKQYIQIVNQRNIENTEVELTTGNIENTEVELTTDNTENTEVELTTDNTDNTENTEVELTTDNTENTENTEVELTTDNIENTENTEVELTTDNIENTEVELTTDNIENTEVELTTDNTEVELTTDNTEVELTTDNTEVELTTENTEVELTTDNTENTEVELSNDNSYESQSNTNIKLNIDSVTDSNESITSKLKLFYQNTGRDNWGKVFDELPKDKFGDLIESIINENNSQKENSDKSILNNLNCEIKELKSCVSRLRNSNKELRTEILKYSVPKILTCHFDTLKLEKNEINFKIINNTWQWMNNENIRYLNFDHDSLIEDWDFLFKKKPCITIMEELDNNSQRVFILNNGSLVNSSSNDFSLLYGDCMVQHNKSSDLEYIKSDYLIKNGIICIHV